MGLKDYGFFKKDKNRTPREKAQKAKLGITARLCGCAYLIYVAVKLIKMTASGQTGINPNVAYTIAGIIILFGAIIIFLTVAEFVSRAKNGNYKTINYYKGEFGENFSEQDMIELEEKISAEKEIEQRRSNSKDSFADREELDKLLYLEHLKKEQDKRNGLIPDDDGETGDDEKALESSEDTLDVDADDDASDRHDDDDIGQE
jgi:hypothetical protein